VPGLADLNQRGRAGVSSVSCRPARYCVAFGGYADDSGDAQAFVVSERNGVWGQAIEVPSLGAPNATTDVQTAEVGSISCTRPGNCLAGGTYGQPYSWAFVAVEKNGAWGKAVNLPGLKTLVTGRYADISSVSCAAPGNCGTGGGYENVVFGDPVAQG
jgi:hypothetical protein